MTGQFFSIGGKPMSSYVESGDALPSMIDDWYDMKYQEGYSSFAKSLGAATYGDNGYFNAIMGKAITAAMFTSDNVFSSLGARPYNHEGVRIATRVATDGYNSEGKFVGLGGMTMQDGQVPPSVMMPVGEFREPYKELPYTYEYGFGLRDLESKDDTVAYQNYIDHVTSQYSNLADLTVLRPVWEDQPTMEDNGVIAETSLNSLFRIIASYTEIGGQEGPSESEQYEITAAQISPYGGEASDFYRFRDVTEDNNLNSQVVDAGWGEVGLETMDDLYYRCMPYWANSGNPTNKVWFMSNIALKKLGNLAAGKTNLLNTVYVQKDFNGVKTVPGRDYGVVLRSFNNVPIITDGNLNYEYGTGKISTSRMNDILLADLDHMWISVTQPVELFTVANPAITGWFRERNVMSMRAETRVDSFNQSGKIIHTAYDAS